MNWISSDKPRIIEKYCVLHILSPMGGLNTKKWGHIAFLWPEMKSWYPKTYIYIWNTSKSDRKWTIQRIPKNSRWPPPPSWILRKAPGSKKIFCLKMTLGSLNYGKMQLPAFLYTFRHFYSFGGPAPWLYRFKAWVSFFRVKKGNLPDFFSGI